MANYAILNGTKIVNVIVADSKEVAEEATGMEAIETSGVPWIDWTIIEGQWVPPQPFPSWAWDGVEWKAPVEQPDPAYYWDEELLDWVRPEITQPFPSWTKDENGDWVAPIPYPELPGPYIWDEDLQNWVLVGE